MAYYALHFSTKGSLSPYGCKTILREFSTHAERDSFVRNTQNPEGYLGTDHARAISAKEAKKYSK